MLTFLLLLGTVSGLTAQSKILENCTLNSNVLNSERKFAIYLPEGYENTDRHYPVMYLLHGMGDDQTGWVQFGEVQRIADTAIREGYASPMIIVMPDANTVQPGYFNDVKGDFNYEDFFFTELIPHVEKTYRCRAEKQYRAVAGLSMGGGGSLVYALHHPEMFCAACPLSAAVRTGLNKQSVIDRYKTKGMVVTEEEIDEWYKKHDILKLMETMPEEQKNAVRWYIDCGDDDFLYEGNSLLHIVMRKNNIPHEYRVRDGGHTWQYWREALPEVMNFVSQTFRR